MHKSNVKFIIGIAAVVIIGAIATFLIYFVNSNSSSPSSQKSHAAVNNTLSASKLGVWREGDHRSDQSTYDLISAGPRVFKVNDFSNEMKFLKTYKDTFPNGTTLVRIINESNKYNDDNGRFKETDDPKTSADLYYNAVIKPALNNSQRISSDNLKYVDYIESPNEFDATPGWDPGVAGTTKASIVKDWISPFWVQLIDDVAGSGTGVKLCIASLPAGNPQYSADNITNKINDFEPALREAKLKGDTFCYHPYIAINKDFSSTCNSTYTLTDSNQKPWSLLYREMYNQIVQAGKDKGEDFTIPFILSETGIDTLGLTGGGNTQASDGGWLSKGTLCANSQVYESMLTWLDTHMKQDSYVIGSTLFQTGDPGWTSHEIDPNSSEQTDSGTYPYSGGTYQGNSISSILPWLIKTLNPLADVTPTPTSPVGTTSTPIPTNIPTNSPTTVPTNTPTNLPTTAPSQKKIKVYAVCSDNSTGMFVPFSLKVSQTTSNLTTPYNSVPYNLDIAFTINAQDVSGITYKGIYHYDNQSSQITNSHSLSATVSNITDAYAIEYTGCSAPVSTSPTPTVQVASCTGIAITKGLSSPPQQSDQLQVTSSISNGVMRPYDWFYNIDNGSWQNYSLYNGEPHDATASTTSFSSLSGVNVGSTVKYTLGNPSGSIINSGAFACSISVQVSAAATPVPPTGTPMPPTNTSLPTSTPIPPTSTPVPTNTPGPTTTGPTPTMTPTPTPSPTLTPTLNVTPSVAPGPSLTPVMTSVASPTPTTISVVATTCNGIQNSINVNTVSCSNVILVSKTFIIKGIAQPNSQVSVSIYGGQTMTVTSAGDGSWSVSNLNLISGINAITVSYLDPNNAAQVSKQFSIQVNTLPDTGILSTSNVILGIGIIFIGISAYLVKVYYLGQGSFEKRMKKIFKRD